MTARLVSDTAVLVLSGDLAPTHNGHFRIEGENLSLSIGDPLFASLTDEARLREKLRRVGAELVDGILDDDEVAVWKEQRWMVTRSVEDVDAWELPHDCETCRAGVAEARLAASMGACVAVGWLRYWVLPNPGDPLSDQ